MNKEEFNRLKRATLAKLDFGYRPIDGAIIGIIKDGENGFVVRWSRSEGWKHYLAKCIIVRLLKEGVPANQMPKLMEELFNEISTYTKPIKKINEMEVVLEDIQLCYRDLYKVKLKKYQVPKIYCEARFSKFLITDILAVTIDGVYAIEIVDKEEEKSLKRKERLYKNMDIEMVVIRV